MWVATLSPPAALCPPVDEWTPVVEGGSSAGRANSPEDSLTVYVVLVRPLIRVRVEPIGDTMCCLQQLSNFLVSVSAICNKQEGLVVHSKHHHML